MKIHKLMLLFIGLFSVHFNNAMDDGSDKNYRIKKTVSGSIIKYDFWEHNQPASVEYNTETQRYSSELIRPTVYGGSQIVRSGNPVTNKKLFEDIESAYKSEKLKQE
jgi:hypothetical protein